MCDSCKKLDSELYKELHKETMLDISKIENVISLHKTEGIRIAQSREVAYMAPNGVDVKTEVACIYVPWIHLKELVETLEELHDYPEYEEN